MRLSKLPAGIWVLVFRTKTKRCKGFSKFIHIEEEIVVVQMDHGRRMFPCSYVKSYINVSSDEQVALATDSGIEPNPNAGNTILNRGSVLEEPISKGSNPFGDARREEILGLIKSDTFAIVDRTGIGNDVCVFGSKFLDQLKYTNCCYRYKSRLIAGNYSDEQSTAIAMKAGTVQRLRQRLFL